MGAAGGGPPDGRAVRGCTMSRATQGAPRRRGKRWRPFRLITQTSSEGRQSPPTARGIPGVPNPRVLGPAFGCGNLYRFGNGSILM